MFQFHRPLEPISATIQKKQKNTEVHKDDSVLTKNTRFLIVAEENDF